MEKGYGTRNAAIDILRALVMMLMIFVNDLWSIEGYPEWLGHSSAMEDFMGLADIVFPCFLIVVGMSIPYAIENRFARGYSGISTVGHILGRSFALIVMGVFTVNSEGHVACITGMGVAWFRILMVIGFFLVWNAYPRTENPRSNKIYALLKCVGAALLLFLAVTFRNGDGGYFQSSWWGILGIIGWTYLVCAMIYLFTRDRLGWLVPIWCGFAVLCILRSVRHGGGTLLEIDGANFFDQILSTLHLGNGCSAALVTGGIILSVVSVRKGLLIDLAKMARLALVGVPLLLCAGIASHHWFITSKIMATAPWLFFNLAIVVGAYALLAWVVKAGKAAWFSIIKPAGTATLTCYVLPYLTYSVTALTGLVLPMWMRTGVVGIFNCIAYAFIIVGFAWLLGRLRIKLKI